MWHSVGVTFRGDDGSRSNEVELPDFHIPHAEKIEWMIETAGWALERGARLCYTIGLHDRFGFPEIAIAGLTPVAAKGLIDLVVEQLEGGVAIPLDVPLVGLLDNELRCVFATVDLDQHRDDFATGLAWTRGRGFPVVQLVWPDRAGLLPHEVGCDARTVAVQPLICRLTHEGD